LFPNSFFSLQGIVIEISSFLFNLIFPNFPIV
jgi:hypothetical protein